MIIAVPNGRPEAFAYSPRYRNQCENRKGEYYVIIQQTQSGCGAIQWRGRRWSVPPGHAFICLVPERFSYFYPKGGQEPWKFTWIEVYGSLARMFCRTLRNLHGPVLALPLGSAPSDEFMNFAMRVRQRIVVDPYSATFDACAFFLNWKRLLDRPQARDADPVARAMRICQARFREPLSIKELAADMGISREHLTRLFIKRAGISPARYLRQLRVVAAQDILSSAQNTQKEAAFRSGFPSVQALQRALHRRARKFGPAG